MKQISGVFFKKKNMIAAVIWTSTKNICYSTYILYSKSPSSSNSRYLFELGPHGLDLIKKLFKWWIFCVQICVPKNDLGKDVLAFRTKNKRVFLSILFLHRLNINRPFSQISIHPWRKIASILKGISLRESGFAGNPCAWRRDGRPSDQVPQTPRSALWIFFWRHKSATWRSDGRNNLETWRS